MKITKQQLRRIIKEELIRVLVEADSDGDGRSDKQELEDIAAGMEETQKRSWDLSEEELRNMSQEEYTNLLRAEADAAMAEDPGLSMSVVAEYDPTRPYFTEYENALEMERSLLSDAIEDVIQSYWGFKPRNYEKYRTMNLQQLRDLYEKEIQRASEHIEEDEGWAKDIEDERRDQMQADLDVANIAAAEAAAEEERMRTPEEGEEIHRQIGMGRGRTMSESFTHNQLRRIIKETIGEMSSEEVHEAVDTDGDGRSDKQELEDIAAGMKGEEESGEELHVDLRGIKVTPQSIARLKDRMRRTTGHISGPRTKDVPLGMWDPRTGKVRTK